MILGQYLHSNSLLKRLELFELFQQDSYGYWKNIRYAFIKMFFEILSSLSETLFEIIPVELSKKFFEQCIAYYDIQSAYKPVQDYHG